MENVVQFFFSQQRLLHHNTDVKWHVGVITVPMLVLRKKTSIGKCWLAREFIKPDRPKETVFHVAAYNMLLFISRYDFVALDGNAEICVKLFHENKNARA